ncbi:2Fe-2S ferredoxin [Ferroacidibacillus organovorans]|uniref:2Fe-2S ferredoxin n=2 Tax=Ferroacidibacillus organovorans TaxID=1765683 RepID=A0A853K9S5_9BACL|nr:2Fe-2S ferredoxin [Ferroacidibacillus organovorans]OAG91653.1 2Fe-2S ferredoxin [Ferroacidibacillus organovorans]
MEAALMNQEDRLPSDDHVFPVAWYAVGFQNELKRKPLKKRLVGRDLVLYRDARGDAQCVTAYCAHRGADLSLGHCTAKGIVCAYHGWAFNEQGDCVDIPAHPNRPIPDFAKVTAYPVIERGGMIWVYPQSKREARPAPLPLFEELESSRFTLAPYEQTWSAHLTRVVESVLDVAHLAFVHKKTIGRSLKPEIADLHVEVPERDVMTIVNGGGTLEYRFPQQWLLRPTQEGKSTFINYVTFTPIDKNRTAIYGYAGRTFARNIPMVNTVFSRYSRKILREDQAVVESQHPRPIPEALRMEAHVPADTPQVRFRNRWYAFLTSDEPKIILDGARETTDNRAAHTFS